MLGEFTKKTTDYRTRLPVFQPKLGSSSKLSFALCNSSSHNHYLWVLHCAGESRNFAHCSLYITTSIRLFCTHRPNDLTTHESFTHQRRGHRLRHRHQGQPFAARPPRRTRLRAGTRGDARLCHAERFARDLRHARTARRTQNRRGATHRGEHPTTQRKLCRRATSGPHRRRDERRGATTLGPHRAGHRLRDRELWGLPGVRTAQTARPQGRRHHHGGTCGQSQLRKNHGVQRALRRTRTHGQLCGGDGGQCGGRNTHRRAHRAICRSAGHLLAARLLAGGGLCDERALEGRNRRGDQRARCEQPGAQPAAHPASAPTRTADGGGAQLVGRVFGERIDARCGPTLGAHGHALRALCGQPRRGAQSPGRSGDRGLRPSRGTAHTAAQRPALSGRPARTGAPLSGGHLPTAREQSGALHHVGRPLLGEEPTVLWRLFPRNPAGFLGHIHHRTVSDGLDAGRSDVVDRDAHERSAQRSLVCRSPGVGSGGRCGHRDCLSPADFDPLFLHFHSRRLGLSGTHRAALRPLAAARGTARQVVFPDAHGFRLQRAGHHGHAHH